MESIAISLEDGTEAELYVIEQTMVGGIPYYLVSETVEGDGEAMIVKDVSAPEDTDALLEFVEEDTELRAVGDIFAHLLEDTEITGVTE